MGNLDRLLEALARKLPSPSDHATIVAALHEAAKALPESQAKTRARLARNEAACVEKLEALLTEAAVEFHEDVAPDIVEANDDPVNAAYAGIGDDDPTACLERCAELLQGALASLRPTPLAEEALQGLLAFLPTASTAINLATLEHCIQLLPTAAAALGKSEPPSWNRFLGFIVAALARLRRAKGTESTQKGAKDIATQVGAIIALSARHDSARSALRHGLSTLAEVLEPEVLGRLAPAVLPIVHVAFSQLNAFEESGANRADLEALLHSLRFVSLCRKANVGEPLALSEACDLLRVALEKNFETAALLPELQNLGIITSKRRRVSKGTGDATGRSSSAIVMAVATMSFATIKRLAIASGLPMGEEQDTDRHAATARARGDLFFEDVSGGGLLEEVTAQASVKLEGLEDLKSDRKKKKKRTATAVEGDEHEAAAE